jgi:hypothetical protein
MNTTVKEVITPNELISLAMGQFEKDYPNSLIDVVSVNHKLSWNERHPRVAVCSLILIELTCKRFLVYNFAAKYSEAYLFERYFEID